MADESASFAINFEDGISGNAKKAAGSLKELQAQMRAEKAEVQGLKAARKALVESGNANEQSLKQIGDRLKVANATLAMTALETANAAKHQKGAAAATEEHGKAAEKNNGISTTALALGTALGGAMLSLAQSTKQAASDLVGFAFGTIEAARAEQLHFEALSRVQGLYYNIKKESGQGVVDSIQDIAENTSVSRDKLVGFATSLQAVGVRGQNLKDALRGMALYSLAGKEDVFLNRARSAAMLGTSIKNLTKDAERRFGDLDRQASLGFSVQFQKLHESLANVFRDLDITPMQEGMKDFLDMFKSTSSIGQSLRTVMEGLFGGANNGAETFGGLVKEAFYAAMETALDFGLGLLDVRDELADLIPAKFFSDMNMTEVTTASVKGAVIALGIAAVGAAMPFIALGAAVGGAFKLVQISADWLANGGVDAIGDAINDMADNTAAPLISIGLGFWNMGNDMKDALDSTIDSIGAWVDSAMQIGKDFVYGIGNGIKDSVDYVVDSIGSLGDSMVGSLKKFLKIGSPSKVTYEMGDFVDQGMALGISDNVEKPRKAMLSLSEAIADSPQRAVPNLGGVGSSSAPSKAGDIMLTIENIIIQAQGAPEDIKEAVYAGINMFLQTARTELGAV